MGIQHRQTSDWDPFTRNCGLESVCGRYSYFRTAEIWDLIKTKTTGYNCENGTDQNTMILE